MSERIGVGYKELTVEIHAEGPIPKYNVRPHISGACFVDGTHSPFDRIEEFKVGGQALYYAINYVASDESKVRFGLTWSDGYNGRERGERWGYSTEHEVWKWSWWRWSHGHWAPLRRWRKARYIPSEGTTVWVPSMVGTQDS